MKKTLSLFCVLCLLLALAGCVQTPEPPLVAQKDVDRLIEKAQQEPDGNALSDLAEKAPGDYQWQTTAYQNRIKVAVDAKVVLPKRDAAPMYRVTAGALTDEQCQAITAYLYKGTPTYEMPQDRTVGLKADVQREIDEYTRALNEGMENRLFQEQVLQWRQNYDGLGLSEEEVQQLAEGGAREDMIRLLGVFRDELPEAVDSYEGVVPRGDGTLHDAEGGTYKSLSLRSELGDQLMITSAEKDQGAWTDLLWVRQGAPEYNLASAKTPAETPALAQARAQADGLFDAAGIEMGCFAVFQIDDGTPDGLFLGLRGRGYSERLPSDASHAGYVFYYTTAVDGLTAAWSAAAGQTGTTEKGQDSFEASWMYEMAYVVVDGDGIATAFWTAPVTEKKTVSENSPLLSFDQAREIFENMVTVPYEGTLATHDAVGWDVPNDVFELSVTEVRLELIRSRASGGERTGLLTPAWVFYGKISGTASAGSDFFPDIILAVNAVDGTILDVDKGY